MSVPEVFERITRSLDQAGIAYMLSGSFASAHYGIPRSTQDIDLVIEASTAQLRAFIEELPASEYYADMGSAQCLRDYLAWCPVTFQFDQHERAVGGDGE
jgi:hypothetical protein